MGIADTVLSSTRYRVIRSFRDLRYGKFKVISQIKRHLPIKPYEADWEILRRGQAPALYRQFTMNETLMPSVFVLLYTMLILGTLISVSTFW